MPTLTRGFAPVPASVGAARRYAAAALVPRGAEHLCDDVRTVVSELATNALLHARTPFRLGVTVGPDRVRVEVTDGSPTRPRPLRSLDREGATGRGLALVAVLSAAWGVDPDPAGGGKTVWCELAVQPGGAGS